MEPMSEAEYKALPPDQRKKHLATLGLTEEKCGDCGAVAIVQIGIPVAPDLVGPPGVLCKKCIPTLKFTCPACEGASMVVGGLKPGEGMKCHHCGQVTPWNKMPRLGRWSDG